MPLSKPLTELLATITDERERNEITQRFEKYPQLQERFTDGLRLDEFNRKMNEQAEEKKKLESAARAATDRAAELQKWWEDNKPIYDRTVSENKQLKSEKEQLEAKVQDALKRHADGDLLDDDQRKLLEASIEQRLQAFERKLGTPATKEEVALIVRQEVESHGKKLEDQFFKETFPTTVQVINQMNRYQMRYFHEFGKEMDTNEFMKFLHGRNQIVATDELYGDFTSPQRKELEKEKMEKEINERVEKEVQQRLSNANYPGGGNGAVHSPEIGIVQQLMRGTKPTENELQDPNVALRIATTEAAQELRQEGKF
jgi:phosphoglycolate phosphatase-like HAD superfamily hydrolase